MISIDSRDKECFRAINSLRKNHNIIITKPDKGSDDVLLNKSDYVDKMTKILDSQSTFKRFGPVSNNDNTASIESCLHKRLLDLIKADLMPKWINDAIQPNGYRRDDVVVRESASQLVDLCFIPKVQSYQKTLKNGIYSFPALRSA